MAQHLSEIRISFAQADQVWAEEVYRKARGNHQAWLDTNGLVSYLAHQTVTRQLEAARISLRARQALGITEDTEHGN